MQATEDARAREELQLVIPAFAALTKGLDDTDTAASWRGARLGPVGSQRRGLTSPC